MNRLLLLVLIVAGCKQDKPKAQPAPAPAPAATTQPTPAPPPTATPTPTEPTAGSAADAPPSPSEIALGKRAEFFGKVNELSKRTGDDCAKLGAELDKLTAEARAITKLRAEVTGEHVVQDDAIVKTSFKSLVRMTSTCTDTAKIDAFLDVVGDVPK